MQYIEVYKSYVYCVYYIHIIYILYIYIYDRWYLTSSPKIRVLATCVSVVKAAREPLLHLYG